MERIERQKRLKTKIRAGEPTLGLFIKIPSPQVVELMAGTQFDCLILDAEHSAFGIDSLDRCIMAAHLAEIPVLVRVPDISSELIAKSLDMGAAGVILPHIRNQGEAETAIAVTRYRDGVRGFAASHRAAGYGAIPAKTHREQSDDAMIVIGQIEDAIAVENISEIVTVSEMDALFIGCADLSVSYGVDMAGDPSVQQAVDKICAVAQKAEQTSAIYLPSMDQFDEMRSKGISFFFVSSDQALLSDAARKLYDNFKIKI